MRTLGTLGLLLLGGLSVPAMAQTSTVGGQSQQTTGSGSFKLTVFNVTQTVELDAFEFYMDPQANGTEVFFVVYHENAGTWDLMWDSGPRAVNPGVDYKPSGTIGEPLLQGERYGLGVFLPPGQDVTYFYGTASDDIGWATVNSSYWAQNGTIPLDVPPDPAFGGTAQSPYHLRVRAIQGEDLDGDGFGDLVDCNDTDPNIYPGAPEACDQIDNDCDDQVDEDVAYRDVFPDADGDGFGNIQGDVLSICEPEPPTGYANEPGDCDDTRADVYPGAVEVCDGFDNDCDGDLLEYEDRDDDLDGVPVCADCDDLDPDTYPGLDFDPCNGVDNDCDGEIPEGKECDPLEYGEKLVPAVACGCDSAPGGGLAWLGLLGLLGLRRRSD